MQPQNKNQRKPYPSDLTLKQFALLEPIINRRRKKPADRPPISTKSLMACFMCYPPAAAGVICPTITAFLILPATDTSSTGLRRASLEKSLKN